MHSSDTVPIIDISPFETLVNRAHPARYAPVTAGQDLVDKLVRQYTREGQEEQPS